MRDFSLMPSSAFGCQAYGFWVKGKAKLDYYRKQVFIFRNDPLKWQLDYPMRKKLEIRWI